MNEPRPTIRIKVCSLHPALRSLIRHIAIIDNDFGKIPQVLEGSFMPSPEQAMFINLHTRFKSKKSGKNDYDSVSSCTLIGAQVTPFKLMVQESHIAVSIIFQPGALNRYLKIPITELFDEGFSARDVIGREIEELIDQSHHAPTLTELDQIVQSYFLGKLSQTKEPSAIDFALQYLLLHYNTPIDRIAAMACMSVRNFERKCHERLGMPAKMYARIARFYRVYKILDGKSSVSWADLSYEAGYYDQMHFIKDFKEFAKLTPTLVHKNLTEDAMRFQIDWGQV